MIAPWQQRTARRARWLAHGTPDLTKEISVMADEGYKIQVSVSDGDTMVNVRADDEGEFALILQNLEESDSPASQAAFALVADGLDLAPKKKSKSKKSKDEDDEDEEEEEEEEDDEDEKPKRRKAPKKKKGSKSKRR